MIQPFDYYRPNEWVAENLSDLKTTFDAIEAYAREHDGLVFWRGQADHKWALASSLVRKLGSTADLDDELLGRVEDKLLEEATDWVAELKNQQFATPLAKLAYLQHHEAPTRLVDFSRNPWTATFFAANDHDQVDGRIFALLTSKNAVLPTLPTDTPWRKYKQDKIAIFDSSAHNITFPRLTAQEGVFAVGRLPSTRPVRMALDPESGRSRPLLAEEVRRILSIPFALSPLKDLGETDRIPTAAVLPIGLTIRLHVDKASVRRDLAGKGSGKRISPALSSKTHKVVYPDVRGMVAYSAVLRGLDKGVLVI